MTFRACAPVLSAHRGSFCCCLCAALCASRDTRLCPETDLSPRFDSAVLLPCHAHRGSFAMSALCVPLCCAAAVSLPCDTATEVRSPCAPPEPFCVPSCVPSCAPLHLLCAHLCAFCALCAHSVCSYTTLCAPTVPCAPCALCPPSALSVPCSCSCCSHQISARWCALIAMRMCPVFAAVPFPLWGAPSQVSPHASLTTNPLPR